MTSAFCLIAALLAADPAPVQMELLTTFRREFIPITPGKGKFPKSFVMGRASENAHPSEQPAHEVTFDYGFEVARYEVPQNLWEAVTGSNPSRWKGPRNSVEMLTFDDAVAFCRKATELMRRGGLIKPDEEIRLPSEAEWEYVARAGTKTIYSFGDDPQQLDEYAWHTGNAAGNDPPVGAKKPNPWGLYDIHGYLWEWCADSGHDTYHGAPGNGSAWTEEGDADRRVIRGGSWKDPASSLTSSCRHGRFRHVPAPGAQPTELSFVGGVSKQLRDDAVGLRCVLCRERR